MPNEDCHGQATILDALGMGVHHALNFCIAMDGRTFDPGSCAPGQRPTEFCCSWRHHDAGFHTEAFRGAVTRGPWHMACSFALDPDFYGQPRGDMEQRVGWCPDCYPGSFILGK
jgi:hypothetical protein